MIQPLHPTRYFTLFFMVILMSCLTFLFTHIPQSTISTLDHTSNALRLVWPLRLIVLQPISRLLLGTAMNMPHPTGHLHVTYNLYTQVSTPTLEAWMKQDSYPAHQPIPFHLPGFTLLKPFKPLVSIHLHILSSVLTSLVHIRHRSNKRSPHAQIS